MSARLIDEMETQARKCRDQAAGFKMAGARTLEIQAGWAALAIMRAAHALETFERAVAEDANMQAEA